MHTEDEVDMPCESIRVAFDLDSGAYRRLRTEDEAEEALLVFIVCCFSTLLIWICALVMVFSNYVEKNGLWANEYYEMNELFGRGHICLIGFDFPRLVGL